MTAMHANIDRDYHYKLLPKAIERNRGQEVIDLLLQYATPIWKAATLSYLMINGTAFQMMSGVGGLGVLDLG